MSARHDYFRTPFRCLGLWWIPESGDEGVAGELRYEPLTGLSLTLVGTMSLPREVRADNAVRSYDVLIGRVVDCPLGELVTLTGCTGVRAVHQLLGGIGTETLAVNCALFGHAFESLDELRFKRAAVYIDQLTNWIASSTMTQAIDFDRDEHNVRFESPPALEATIDECTVSVGFLRVMPSGGSRAVQISEVPFFSVACGSPRTVDEMLRTLVFPLQNLSTLASDHVSELTAVDLEHRLDDGRFVNIHLLFRQVPERREAVRYLYAEQMLFTTKDMPFARMVERWIRFANTHSEVVELYFSVVCATALLGEAKFFMLMQVVEAYHRDRHPGTEVSVEEYEEKTRAILDAAPTSHRKWLKEKLKYANELTLRKRIKALVADDVDALRPVIGDDTAAFIGTVVDTRNYMAHRTEELRQAAARDKELFWLSQEVRLLLKLCLLREVGCSVEERKTIIERHLTFSILPRSRR